MSHMDWHLGWWAPQPLAVEPTDIVDPHVHGPLLAAAGGGSPLDPLGQARLDALKAAGLATPKGRPRFPVARAEQADALRAACGDLGSAIARLLAGEWSRIEVEYEPIRTTVPGAGAPAVAFLVVGGLVLDVGVRRLLRLEGLAAPPFGSAFVWLAEGESHAVAGAWSARVTSLPGRGHLIRFGRPDASHWGLAVVDPEAAPALPTRAPSAPGRTRSPSTPPSTTSPPAASSPHQSKASSPSASPTPPSPVSSPSALAAGGGGGPPAGRPRPGRPCWQGGRGQ